MSDSKFPLLARVDWGYIEGVILENRANDVESAATLIRKALLTAVVEHCEFVDLFLPHLSRVPRDVDGKLLENRDAGCSPPCSILGPVKQPYRSVDEPDRLKAIDTVWKYGTIVLKDAVPLEVVEAVREGLRIRSTYSGRVKKPFQTRETDPQKIFEGERSENVSFTQLAAGRFSYRLRCSALEALVKPIHAGIMPLVWDYLYIVRKDSFLHSLTGDSSEGIKPRIFLSEISLICSDPLAGNDSWHATNGAPGVVVLVPLSPYEPKNGNTLLLPGSHKMWEGIRGTVKAGDTFLQCGGVQEIKADMGDVVMLDSRLMRMTTKNELFDRSKVWLAFHYDFTDTPAPQQWLPRTIFMNFLSVFFLKLDNWYKTLPSCSM